jgi:hypothetical protein
LGMKGGGGMALALIVLGVLGDYLLWRRKKR